MYQISKDEKLQKQWEGYVEKNKDPYGGAVIDVTIKVCKLLDKGKSPQEAEDEGIKDSEITGFMAGAMASSIVHFHPRGEEFKKYWNERCGNKNAKGVINPALITVQKKEGV